VLQKARGLDRTIDIARAEPSSVLDGWALEVDTKADSAQASRVSWQMRCKGSGDRRLAEQDVGRVTSRTRPKAGRSFVCNRS
jgi:hypothetical protein